MTGDAGLRRRRSLSIALRMTVWYALSAFVLIFVATGFLYWFLATNLEREDTQLLDDSLNNVGLILRASPSNALRDPSDRTSAATFKAQPQLYVRILDSGGRTILETPGMPNELSPPTSADLAALGTGREVSDKAVSRSGKPFQTLLARVADENRGAPVQFIQIAMDRRTEKHLLVKYRERFWLILSASLVLSAIAGYVIARGGMRPIANISRAAERIQSTTLYERISMAGLPPELSGLTESFNNMLDRLQESFARISQFSDDVAHELRTPINNLRGELEVALSKARSSEDYHEILGSSLEECARISRVIQSLLLLARAENASEPLERDNIDVGKEVTLVQEFYEAAAAEAGVDLRASVAADLHAALNRTLFQQAVGNLVSNAITHTPKGGTVQILACADETGLRVSVTDTGCGIAPEHLPHVTDRFYRVDRARSGSRHNVGLGLAVVKGIVGRHAGTIEIDSDVGRGTQVTMSFPRSDHR